MGHDAGMLDEAFYRAQTFGKRKETATLQHTHGGFLAAFHHCADHAAEGMHLAFGEGMLRVTGKARINDTFDVRVLFQPIGNGKGAGGLAVHA